VLNRVNQCSAHLYDFQVNGQDQGAGCSTSIASLSNVNQLTSTGNSNSSGGDGSTASTLPSSSKAGEATDNENRSMQWSQLNTSINSNSSMGSEASNLEEANTMLNSLTIENQKLKRKLLN